MKAESYYSRNRDKVLAYQREYRSRPDYNKNASEYDKRKRRENPQVALWRSCKKRAARDNLDFSIEVSDIFIPKVCPILLIPIEHCGSKVGSHPSVDRIDNSKGYIKGNVKVISRKANAMKCDMTLESVRRLLIYMEN